MDEITGPIFAITLVLSAVFLPSAFLGGIRPFLSPDRVRLFEAVEGTGSIGGAARQVGMSCRRAWMLVQEINTVAGGPLIVATTGDLAEGARSLRPNAGTRWPPSKINVNVD